MLRLLNKTIRLNLKFTPARNFSANESGKQQEHEADFEEDEKERAKSDYDKIWEEFEREREKEPLPGNREFKRFVRNMILWGLFGWFSANAYIAFKSGLDEDVASEYKLYNQYMYTGASAIVDVFNKGYNYVRYPPITKFLPDEPPLKPELLRKTLVLNFEGTLYAKDFSAGSGVLIHLRPGFKKFIDKMSQMYDIVLYSNEDTAFMTEVIQTIDPYQRYFMWNLGREFFTVMPDGSYKDLRFINRDPKKFIVVDFSSDHYLNNKDNVVVLDKYNGEMEDNGLKELGLFLEHCASPSVKDLRKEIKKYGGEESVRRYYDDIQKKVDNVKKRRSWLFGPANKAKSEHN